MTNSPAPLLEAHALHLWRGERHLLKGVSFTLRAGELLQVIGPNGVGKTTLLRCCCELLPVESGQLRWKEQPIERARDDYHTQLAYLAHGNALKADLTAVENLRYELGVRKRIVNETLAAQLDVLGIGHCAHLPTRALSAGQRRRLALARVILCKAHLWILDEPTTNLDADGIALVERLMLAHLLQGGAILAAAHHRLLATHSASKTLELEA